MCMDRIIEILTAGLAPVTTIAVVYIAWQQLKTNKQKLKLDKYDRRLHVYGEVNNFIYIAIRKDTVTDEDFRKFNTSVVEADFLFGEEITKYIQDVRGHAAKLRRWKNEYRDDTQDKPVDYDHNTVVKELFKERLWFSKQPEDTTELFRKYLDLSK